MREIKIKYLVIRKNGRIFSQTFTLKEIENGTTERWLNYNSVSDEELHRLLFTGLHDKKGKEIFEGYILGNINKHEVKWHDDGFIVKTISKDKHGSTCPLSSFLFQYDTEIIKDLSGE